MFWPPACIRTAGTDPLTTRQLRRGHLNLRRLIRPIRLSRPNITRRRTRTPHRLRRNHQPPITHRNPTRPQPTIHPIEIIRPPRRHSRAGDRNPGHVRRRDRPRPIRNHTRLPRRSALHRHAVGRTIRQPRRKRKRAVPGHTQIITAVVPQHQRPRQPRHTPTNRIRRRRRTGNRNPGHVRRRDRPRPIRNHTRLPRRSALHRHAVGRTIRQPRRKRKRADHPPHSDHHHRCPATPTTPTTPTHSHQPNTSAPRRRWCQPSCRPWRCRRS